MLKSVPPLRVNLHTRCKVQVKVRVCVCVCVWCVHEPVDAQSLQHHLLQRLPSSLSCFCIFVKNQLGSCLWVCFWVLYFVHWSVPIIPQYHTVLVTAIIYSRLIEAYCIPQCIQLEMLPVPCLWAGDRSLGSAATKGLPGPGHLWQDALLYCQPAAQSFLVGGETWVQKAGEASLLATYCWRGPPDWKEIS